MTLEDCSRMHEPLAIPEIVVLPTEIDICNAAQVRRELTDAVQQHACVVIADMSQTEFCDCSGVRALLAAHDAAAARGSALRLVIRSEAVLRIVHLLGIDAVLSVYSGTGQALADPRSPARRTGLRPGDQKRLTAGLPD